jgi:hypothetical protein
LKWFEKRWIQGDFSFGVRQSLAKFSARTNEVLLAGFLVCLFFFSAFRDVIGLAVYLSAGKAFNEGENFFYRWKSGWDQESLCLF